MFVEVSSIVLEAAEVFLQYHHSSGGAEDRKSQSEQSPYRRDLKSYLPHRSEGLLLESTFSVTLERKCTVEPSWVFILVYHVALQAVCY